MSNGEDGERGWFDELQPFEWDSREHGSPDWDSYGNHGEEGSHWHWELGANWQEYQEAREQGLDGPLDGDRFFSLSDANEVARYLAEHPEEWIDRIKEDTNGVGQIGMIQVVWDEDDGAWRIELDAYIEY